MPAIEYAKAFYSLASQDDLANFNTFVENINGDFISIMESKRISTKEKIGIINKVIVKEELLGNFLKVLVENNRFNLCASINKELKRLDNKKNNVATVDIIVKEEITKAKQKEVTSKLKAILQKDIDANVIVDPSIIGGIKIKYDGKILDHSIMSTINELKKELSK